MTLPITREQALELLEKFNPKENKYDWNHFLESEAIMKGVALKLGEDEDYWGMLGLLHDIDWGMTKNNLKEHTLKAKDILKEAGFDEEFIDIIESHGYGYKEIPSNESKKRDKNIEFALAASETLTGLINAYAIMRGGIEGMEVRGLKKKFKDKTFAAGCNREIIKEIENCGLELDEFFEIAISEIVKIKKDVEL